MKKLIVGLMIALLSLTFIPTQAKTNNNCATNSIAITTKPNEEAEAKALVGRLYEIKAMDKSHLSSFEKRQLRKEVRSIRQHLRDISGGIYLSTGALIIIIILLLILL